MVRFIEYIFYVLSRVIGRVGVINFFFFFFTTMRFCIYFCTIIQNVVEGAVNFMECSGGYDVEDQKCKKKIEIYFWSLWCEVFINFIGILLNCDEFFE